MKKYFFRYILIAVVLIMGTMTARSIVRTQQAKSMARAAASKKVGYCHCNTQTGSNWCCCYDPGPDPDCNPISNCDNCRLIE
jgi:hypothetical protein